MTSLFVLIRGVHSEWLYRTLEAAHDGIIDFRLDEAGEETRNLIRVRSMQNVGFDSRWHPPQGQRELRSHLEEVMVHWSSRVYAHHLCVCHCWCGDDFAYQPCANCKRVNNCGQSCSVSVGKKRSSASSTTGAHTHDGSNYDAPHQGSPPPTTKKPPLRNVLHMKFYLSLSNHPYSSQAYSRTASKDTRKAGT